MKTHEVLDTIYHEDEGQSCFVGTYQECINFVTEQQTYGLEIVPLSKEQYIFHNQ